MARELRTGADQVGLAPPPHLDGIVGDETMAAHDEIERAFALADAAVTGDQYAQAEDVHQHAVDDFAHGKGVFEQHADFRDRHRRGDRRPQQRHLIALGSLDQLCWRLPAGCSGSRRGFRGNAPRSLRTPAPVPAAGTRGIRRGRGRFSGYGGWRWPARGRRGRSTARASDRWRRAGFEAGPPRSVGATSIHPRRYASASINPRLPSGLRKRTLMVSVAAFLKTRNESSPSTTSRAASSTDIGFTS